MSAPYPIAFFSRTIKAGQAIDLDCPYALQITNACLTGHIQGTERSVLTLSYQDSFTPEDINGEEDLDLSDDDEEEEEEKDAPKSVQVADKKGKKASKAKDAEPADVEMSEDDEEYDSDGDSDFDADSVIRTTTLASLIPEKIEQSTINITLNRYESYLFDNQGPNDISISGQWFYQADPVDSGSEDGSDDDESGSDLAEDEFGLYDPETGLLGGEITENLYDEDSEDAADDSARFEEIKETPQKSKKEKKTAKASAVVNADESAADVSMSAADVSKADASIASIDTDNLSKNQKKKLKKLAAKEKKGEETPAKEEAAKPKAKEDGLAKKPSNRVTLPSGLVYIDSKSGSGSTAKKGSKVNMRYIGKLDNGKVFDSNTKGKAFAFTLGAGEVIKGWDEGIAGMAVGGERKLIIPSKLAYGKRGSPPDIPGNATLTFDVKLLSIK